MRAMVHATKTAHAETLSRRRQFVARRTLRKGAKTAGVLDLDSSGCSVFDLDMPIRESKDIQRS